MFLFNVWRQFKKHSPECKILSSMRHPCRHHVILDFLLFFWLCLEEICLWLNSQCHPSIKSPIWKKRWPWFDHVLQRRLNGGDKIKQRSILPRDLSESGSLKLILVFLAASIIINSNHFQLARRKNLLHAFFSLEFANSKQQFFSV